MTNANIASCDYFAVDFFCGAGGMSLGLANSGIKVLAGIDNEQRCQQTYEQIKNNDLSSPKFLCKDIFPATEEYPSGEQQEISEQISNLLEQAKKRSCNETRLIFAICAPCQPFTKITKIELSDKGKFKRNNDKNLLMTTLNLIEEFKPDAIIVENVEGISDGGEGSVLSGFKSALNKLGYFFDSKIVNSGNFSVPQLRKRTIGMAVHKSRSGTAIGVPEKDPNSSHVNVSDAIGHFPAICAGEAHESIPNHRARSLNDLNLKRISCAPPGETNGYLQSTRYGDLSLACHRRLKAKSKSGTGSFSDTYTRMHPARKAPTMTTKCTSITNGRFGHYDTSQHRAISVREAAAIQSFPDNYVFYPETQVEFTAKLIGNAVPPKLAEYFGKFLVQQL